MVRVIDQMPTTFSSVTGASWMLLLYASILRFLTVSGGEPEYFGHGDGSSLSRGPRESQHVHGLDDEHGHNAAFDHEAILGSEDAENEFSKLTPHEAKQRLAELLKKMDLNRDGLIQKDELSAWVVDSFRKRERVYAQNKMLNVDKDEDGMVTWEEYEKKIYGYTLEQLEEFEKDPRPQFKTFVNMVNDDKAKFQLADIDRDGFLTVDEYAAFLYPHSHERMHGYEVQRMLNDLDKNGDDQLSFEEYIGTSTPGTEQLIVDKENFKSYDVNDDKLLDREEIKAWAVPDQRLIAEDEADHLIRETDMDKDGVLTTAEILGRHDLWVGSSATEYGDSLRRHTEL